MMNKKYLMNGFAALALIAGFSSCVKDVDGVSQADQEVAGKANAEMQLGLTIPKGQSWDMSTQISANVNVNLKSGESYDVAVYANDPIADGVGKVLAKGTVQGGKTYTTKFTGSMATSQLYVGVTDKNNYTRYKLAAVKNGQLAVDFGVSDATARSMRAVTINGDTYDTFNFPTTAELTAVFPTAIPSADGTTGLNNYNTLVNNGGGHNYAITSAGDYTIGGGWQNISWVTDEEYPNGHSVVNYINVYVAVGANENVTITRNGNINFNLYVLSGKVTLASDFGEMSGIISIASGATLNDARDHIASNYGIHVYNKGTYNATNTTQTKRWDGSKDIYYSFDIGNNASIYNEGTFTVSGGLSYSAGAGNTSYFVNFGDDAALTAPSMQLNSTCHFFTDGNVNITGLTSVTQSGITWINNGHYTTGSLKFSAKNTTFYNYCQLKVTGNTWFLDGEFNLMPNSYTEMNTGIFNNFCVNMHDNSGIYIKGGSKWGRQGAGIYQGFRTVNDNATAYVRLGGHSQVPHHKGGAIHFNGQKLTYAIENITFYEEFSGIALDKEFSEVTYSTPKTAEDLATAKSENITFDPSDTAEQAVYSEMSFTEPAEGECAATWGEDGSEKIEEPVPYTFAFEDQIYNGDYDMNDVVLKITPHVVKSGNKITAIDYNNLDVKLVASGATFKIKAYIDDTALFDGKEIHNAFGKYNATEGATQSMINTGKGVTADPVTCTIATPSDIKSTDADGNVSLDFSRLNIWIWVNPETGFQSEAKIYYLDEKEWPYAVMIPNDWAWPTERTIVTSAYAGTDDAETVPITVDGTTVEYKENSFSAWAASETRTAIMNGWFNYPVTGKTMTNASTSATTE
ncbi:MAG: DUF4842 domain-containing protein [Prevotella sp.]|nr:DUF4842 domain-containing protein [Prevotella sp.]